MVAAKGARQSQKRKKVDRLLKNQDLTNCAPKFSSQALGKDQGVPAHLSFLVRVQKVYGFITSVSDMILQVFQSTFLVPSSITILRHCTHSHMLLR